VRALLSVAGTTYADEAGISELLETRWKGDLRRLRDAADHDPDAERRLLKQFKGIGDVGVHIFFREAQAAWDELRPFFDDRALDGAGRVGLPKDPDRLAGLVKGDDLARLSAALVRAELDDGVRDAVRERAR
jgi:hypothetical protein